VRQLAFHAQGWEDFCYWATNDRAITKRIIRLITETLRDPFAGIGKPEPLKHSLPGAWSRRITDEHRLVYLVTDKEITVLQARFHYGS
jgi:toxin YoeB